MRLIVVFANASNHQVLFLLSKAMILLIEKNNMDEAAEILATTTPILDSWIGTSTLTESLRVFELVLKVAFSKYSLASMTERRHGPNFVIGFRILCKECHFPSVITPLK